MYVERTYSVVKYVSGKAPASLNLHPAVYFWGATGNHQPSMFLAVCAFVQSLVERRELIQFTEVRARFEEFLVGNSAISKHILSKYGGWRRSVTPIQNMLRNVFDGLAENLSEDAIERKVLGQTETDPTDDRLAEGRSLWRVTKSTLRRDASLKTAMRCPICRARMVVADASDDHKERRVDGGGDGADNGQMLHQYCNHGFKEHFAQKGLPVPEISFPA